jgi:hypothetical protein
MTTSNDDSTQERIIYNDEERNTVMRSVFEADDKAERREALVELLIDLRQHIGEHGEGWQRVYLELHRLVEWLFKGSETYDLALELYEQRFHVRGGIEPSEVLRMVMDKYLSPPPPSESGWLATVVAESGSRFSPEQYKKRLEVASAAIFGTDAQRIDCMHGCLSADTATLLHILKVLDEP